MKNYSGPCYTLSEAQDILSMRPSELAHAVRKGEIQAVIYTELRNMLLFLPRESGDWVGCATCKYRGHMSLHIQTITSLLDGQTIHIGQGWGRLWEEFGVSNWSSQYPFQRELPHGAIKEWQAVEREQFPINKLCATPLPNEFTPWTDSLAAMMEQVAKSKLEARSYEDFQKSKYPELGPCLDFKANSEFKPGALRISNSEIERYRERQSEWKKEQRVVTAIDSAKSKNPKMRGSQLHQLIERIIQAEPGITAKEAWKLIEQDAGLDEPIFDIEHILERVDSDCIEWCSRDGNDQSLSWPSFKATLSKLKKKHSAEYHE